MDKRPDAETNGQPQGSGKISRLYYLEEFKLNEPVKKRFTRKRGIPLFPLSIFCVAIALAAVVAIQDNRRQIPAIESSKLQSFRWAVNRAMGAAELTQAASSKDEWLTVSTWWQEAIDFMESVPVTHPQYQLAQDKVLEYQENLEYAQRKAAQIPSTRPSTELWSVGSRRIDVLRIQGSPSQNVRYDALCQEVLYYNNSTVELNNGIVVKFDNLDKNLKAASPDVATTSLPTEGRFFWTLGSTRDEVFAVQGTPDRVTHYDSVNRETFYYGSSAIELTEGRVTGYSNLDSNLRVRVVAVPVPGETSSFWTVGSERNELFRIQGTPTQVTLDNSLCKETLYYGDSTIELKNGFVTGYDNLSQNLKVRVH